MPDAIPPFDPRPGDYDAMLGRATHRRRVRRVRALAAVAPVVTLAVALAALPGGNAASLRPAGDGTTVAGESPEPSATEQPRPRPADGPPPPTGDPGHADPSPGPTGDPTGDPGAEPEPSEGPDASPASPKPSYGPPTATGEPNHPAPSESPAGQPEAVAKYAYLDDEAPASCSTEGGARSAPDTANWCASYAGETSLDAGSVVSLPFRLCRSRAALPGRLTRYDPSSWMKARVVDGDGWVWAHWRRAEQPAVPVIDVAAGDCVQWTVQWRVTVEPGEYRLNLVFIVEEYGVGGDANHFAVTVRG